MSSDASGFKHQYPIKADSTLPYAGTGFAPDWRIAANRAAVTGSASTVNCAPLRSIPARCAAWHRLAAELGNVYRCGVRPERNTFAIQARSKLTAVLAPRLPLVPNGMWAAANGFRS